MPIELTLIDLARLETFHLAVLVHEVCEQRSQWSTSIKWNGWAVRSPDLN